MKKAPAIARQGYDWGMTWLLAVVLKPFIALIVLTLVLLLARVIYRYMPEGKLKTRLFAPLPGHQARDWSPFTRQRKR